MDTIEMVVINEGNIESEGCYCLRSKPNSTGYKNKDNWLMGRFSEGLKYIKM